VRQLTFLDRNIRILDQPLGYHFYNGEYKLVRLSEALDAAERGAPMVFEHVSSPFPSHVPLTRDLLKELTGF
jgi:hypothetical protein